MRVEPALGSTYRLQLHGLGFAAARRLVPYLHALGIETLYLSPLLTAVRGSTHGYDVVDPGTLDPALGTRDDFEALLDELAGHGMRALLDVVPNHMATDPANRWWRDTLRRGRASDWASTFDVDWTRHGGRVLVPVLGRPLAEALADASVHTGPENEGDRLHLDGQSFPLAPESDVGAPVAEVLAAQHFQPAYWRLGDTEGNYRRFFNIDGLVGVRVEDPAVFEHTHALVLELAADERVAGVRVDHVDGLWDPAGYLAQLRAELTARHGGAVVLVEKILSRDEHLDPRFDVDGTTGYEFADRAGGLFLDEEGCRRLAALGMEMTGQPASFEELALAAKAEMLDGCFSGQLDRVAALAKAVLDAGTPGHDLSLRDVRRAVAQLTVHLNVYRTYLDGTPAASGDVSTIQRAQKGGSTGDPQDDRALRLISDGMVCADAASPWLDVARRWQQLSGADTAKGVEDTATYRYPGLLAQADVGCDPERAATTVEQFHRFARARAGRSATLNASSTHDSKRNEDARCRLAVLSEAHDEWEALVRRWHRRHAGTAASDAPDALAELVAYQSLVALWPPGQDRLPSSELRRVRDYAVKAAREARRATTWTDPDERYERALTAFITRVARQPESRREMARLARSIGCAAATNALALLVLKAIAPGVPDFYQGTEFFEATLTDPDNRRPVDFDTRCRALAALPPAPARAVHAAQVARLLAGWENGHIKLYVTRALLHLRRELPDLFTAGSYVPLDARGPSAASIVALARRRGRQWVVAVVPRLTLAQAGRGRFPTGRRTWPRETVALPGAAPTSFTDIFTGAPIEAARGRVSVAVALQTLPVAVLRSQP
ncbi:MAG TPA: malto-oligosyltrehalose synthase [Acidimicrobiales bacterium]|nr:malto-oligosyltrehalose synthase [Acidimicrobiales bacterium]